MTDERTQDRDNAYATTLRENRELRADRDRLADALQRIASIPSFGQLAPKMQEIARAALAQTERTP